MQRKRDGSVDDLEFDCSEYFEESAVGFNRSLKGLKLQGPEVLAAVEDFFIRWRQGLTEYERRQWDFKRLDGPARKLGIYQIDVLKVFRAHFMFARGAPVIWLLHTFRKTRRRNTDDVDCSISRAKSIRREEYGDDKATE